jgi:hypothetical protein
MPGGTADVVIAPDDEPDTEPILIGAAQHVITFEIPDV